jgi:hypothetical protein
VEKTEHTINIDVQEDGHIVLKTEAEEIPTIIVQQVLDNVVGTVIKITKEKYSNAPQHTNERIYKFIALLEFVVLILIAIKLS